MYKVTCRVCGGDDNNGDTPLESWGADVWEHRKLRDCVKVLTARAEAAEAERDALRAQLDELTERYTECVGLLANNNLLYHLTGYRSPLLDAKED